MNCIKNCPKAKEIMRKLLDEQDSVFDAVSEMEDFVMECKKSCSEENI